MTPQWRLFLTALRFDTRLPAAALRGEDVAYPSAAARYLPIAGVLSMLAATAMSGGAHEIAGADQPAQGSRRKTAEHAYGVVAFVFAVLLKFNALMALSAASLPFAVPANAALGLIMICGHAAGCALLIS